MVIYKFFTLVDYKKKENWINEMCLKGYALKKFNFCRYEFEQCNIGEYYYCIEFFQNLSSNPQKEDLISYFKDQWNIEYVCHYDNWVFFRRERTSGKFSLFQTADAKSLYFKKIISFRFKVFSILILINLLNILSFSNYNLDKILSIIILLISLFVLLLNIPNVIEYKNLKKSTLF